MLNKIKVWASRWPIYDRKVRGMLIQSASSQPGLVRGTVVFLENSITVRITEQHKWMEFQPSMQDPWLHEPHAIFSASHSCYVVGIETPHSMYSFPVLYSKVLCFLAQARRAARWRTLSNNTLVVRRLPKPIR
ncbi:hypothetical protein TNCV_2190241 [Trichonephila clavipes]|uniref:Uncharacterized protein n=1 Tax=Trichonephila clavipes TaxID=2585209 RepID=A0A8X6RDT3_TRICX|nr:hypothetical protein TNCV_2190241 [Trichonephila clavipes]